MKTTTHAALGAAYNSWEQTAAEHTALAGSRLAGVVWAALQMDVPDSKEAPKPRTGLESLDPEDFEDVDVLHAWEKRAEAYGHLEDEDGTGRCTFCDLPVEMWSGESHWLMICSARTWDELEKQRESPEGNVVKVEAWGNPGEE